MPAPKVHGGSLIGKQTPGLKKRLAQAKRDKTKYKPSTDLTVNRVAALQEDRYTDNGGSWGSWGAQFRSRVSRFLNESVKG